MADEKLVIEVELDTSKAEQQASALKNDMQSTGKATGESSEYAKSLAQSLTAIKNLNLGTLFTTAFTGAIKPAKELKDYITNMGSAFTGITTTVAKSLATRIKHIPELFKDSYHTFDDSTWEKLANIGKVRKTWKDFFKDTNNQLKENLGQFEKWGSKIKTIAKVVGTYLILKIMSALKKIAMQVSELGNQIDKSSQKADMSAGKYQQWTYIFERCGLSADDLNTSMKMLQRNVAKTVAQGKYAGSAYEKLGLSMTEISNLKSDELFERTVQKLQQVGNQAERTAVAYEIFGRSATQLNTILNASNADVERLKRTYDILGAKMSNDLVKASARLQDAMTDLKNAGQGLKNVVGQALIPSITKLVHWLAKAIAYVTMFIRAINGFKSTGRTTEKNTASMGGYTKAVDSATKAVEKLKRSQLGFDEMNILPSQSTSGVDDLGSAIEDMDFGGIGDLGETLFTDEELAKMEEFQKKMDKIADTARYVIPILLVLGGALMIIFGVMGLGKGGLPLLIGGIALCGLGIAVGDANGAWDGIFKWLKELMSHLEGFWGYLKPLLLSIWDSLKSLWDSTKGLLKAIWEFIKPWLQALVDLLVPVIKFIVELVVEAINLILPILNHVVVAVTGIINGIIGAVDGLVQFLAGVIDLITGLLTLDTERILNGARNIWQGFLKFFKGIWDGIVSIVQGAWRILKFLFEQIINAVKDAINWVGQLFNKTGGTTNIKVTAGSNMKMATGGIVNSATLTWVGENGKEAVVPLENNTQWMDKLAERLAPKQPTKIVLAVDGKELGYTTIDSINAITTQTGSLQLKLA